MTGKKRQGSRYSWLLYTVLAILFLGLLATAYAESLRDMYEIGSTMLFPNAEREFGYGEEHFDDTKPEAYNIRLAEYFFSKAAKSDTAIPYLYHELARIAFLNADYQQALVDINLQISLHGDSEPKAYYVRGLIEGYMGLYDAAATDYAHFLTFEPHNWAAKNDEAWVLLKAKRYSEALDVTNSGLADVPANAWLLNSKATALFELGEYKQALDAAQKAYTSVENLTPQEWSIAYPGNDPAIASEGLDVFRKSVVDNMHTIQSAIASSTVQSK